MYYVLIGMVVVAAAHLLGMSKKKNNAIRDVYRKMLFKRKGEITKFKEHPALPALKIRVADDDAFFLLDTNGFSFIAVSPALKEREDFWFEDSPGLLRTHPATGNDFFDRRFFLWEAPREEELRKRLLPLELTNEIVNLKEFLDSKVKKFYFKGGSSKSYGGRSEWFKIETQNFPMKKHDLLRGKIVPFEVETYETILDHCVQVYRQVKQAATAPGGDGGEG
ncbi:MAG: hypothetical protein GF333_08180 [Candidatus Omnitrophica bacterium]|nr:hypothetical protein [Candidatus Omnitrophota bacterium]